MCQAVRDGGRRCPRHKHGSIAVFSAIKNMEGNLLSRTQIENVFVELRREGADTTRETPNFNIATLIEDITDSPSNSVTHQVSLTRSTDETFDFSTQYALARLKARTRYRSQKLKEAFTEISSSHGTTEAQVSAAYYAIIDSIDVSRGSTPPAEYTSRNRRICKEIGLPADKASVAAFVRVRDAVLDNSTQEMPWTVSYEYNDLNSTLKGYDYNAQHKILRVKIDGIREPVVYGNVEAETVADLLSTRRPLRTFNAKVVNNPNTIKFETSREGQLATQIARCNNCGQFTSLSQTHECPTSNTGFNPYLSTIVSDDAESINTVETVVTPAVFAESEIDRESRIRQARTGLASWMERHPDHEATPHGTFLPEGYETPSPDISAEPGTDHNQIYRLSYETIPTEITADNALFPHTEETVPILNNPQPEHPTKDNQSIAARQPAPQPQEVFNASYYKTIICNSTNYERRLQSHNTVPQAHKDIIRESPKQVMWVLIQENDVNSEWKLKAYDSNLFTGATSNGNRISISNRGKRIIVGSRNQEAENEAQEHLNNILAQPNVVSLTGRGRTNHRVSASGAEASFALKAPNGTYDARTRLSEALSSGKIVALPIETTFVQSTEEKHIDNQGYNVRLPRDVRITGNAAIRMNSDGGIEVLSKERTLKCNCNVYQESYYCRHVNYYQRHLGAMVQELVPVYKTPEGMNEEIPLAVRRRTDVSMAEGNIVGFGLRSYEHELENLNTRRLDPASSVSSSPYAFYSGGNITEEQLNEVLSDKRIFDRSPDLVFKVPHGRAAIIETLKTHDVRVPLVIENIDNQELRGNVTYKKNDGDYNNLEVDVSNLRCDCREYRENNYNCAHTRLVKNNALMFIYPESLRIFATESIGKTNNEMQQAIANQMASQIIAESPELNDGNTNAQSIASLILNTGTANGIREQVISMQEYAVVGDLSTASHRQARIAQLASRANRSTYVVEESRRSNRITREYQTYRENMLQRWETVEENTKDNFHAVALAARNSRNIDFRTENVTDGICAEGPGTRSFGIEIEFDIASNSNRSMVLENIGRELHAAGLTRSSRQDRYHAAARNGWADWSFEHDSTVAGEIVSPLMKDTPEHWEQLRKVCEIVKNNGGIASTRTGSHVHISTGSYENSLAKHYELLRQTQINRQTIFRLASDPSRGRHRGTRWCEPNNLDDRGDIQGNLAERYMSLPNSHGNDMNFGGCGNSEYSRSHVEFRMWDGTIDPAAIQQQVMVSAALTDLAERNIQQQGVSRGIPVELNPLYRESGQARAGIPTSSRAFFEDDMVNHSYNFINKLFRKQEDRNTVTQLFGRTNWVRG